MTVGELFWALIFTFVLSLGGADQINRKNTHLGLFMLAIPFAFWVSRYFGVQP